MRPGDSVEIESVLSLASGDVEACDFSFDVSGELIDPYRDLFAVRPVAPRRKDYGFDPAAWAPEVPDRSALFQARLAGRLAGFAAIAEIWNGMAEIGEFAVDRAVRGRGVAAALLSAAESWARARKFRFIRVETQACNPAACRTYARAGFSLGGHDRFLYAGGADDGEVALFWYKALL